MRAFPTGPNRVRDKLEQLILTALDAVATELGADGLRDLDAGLERARDPAHGDFASNVALRAAKIAQRKPRELAEAIIARLDSDPGIAAVEIAGPGFINFRLATATRHDMLRRILSEGDHYGRAEPDSGERILVEFVSANPTGPLHVGHGRHAAYGASLINILRAAGHTVDDEYYVNDAGRQMDILAASVWLRYADRLGSPIPFPANCYQGTYCRDIAATLENTHGNTLLGDSDAVAQAARADAETDDARLDTIIAAIKQAVGNEAYSTVFAAALDSVLSDIKRDLAEFGASPSRWFSERSLTDSGAVDQGIAALERSDSLYEQDGATWFRTTRYGDDKDRVVVRENGARTYFASDIAYHYEKCERGYDRLLNVLGSDHHGYVARLRAAIEALGHGADKLEVRLMQFVVLYRGEQKMQMSTRSGEYVTLRDLREEVGNDAARFFYVSRSNDQHLEFDLELAKSQSSDNPVYYVQYAHARVANMVDRLKSAGHAVADPTTVQLDALSTPLEQGIMRELERYPEVVRLAADNRAPQHVVHYLRELAGEFHAFYTSKEHKVLTDDSQLRDARVALSIATQQVLRNALALLGVSAPDTM